MGMVSDRPTVVSNGDDLSIAARYAKSDTTVIHMLNTIPRVVSVS